MTPALQQCWAKTDPATGLPALTVRDHCLIVGMVARAIWELMSPRQREIFPQGAVLVAALHDIGKLTPGFQLKAAPYWTFDGAKGGSRYEGNHAKVSQAWLEGLPAAEIEQRAPDWVLALGGHHGSYASPQPYAGKIDEEGLSWPADLRAELFAQLLEWFGPLPSENIRRGPRIHWLTGFISFADWIGSDTGFFPLGMPGDLKDRADPQQTAQAAAESVAALHWHRRRVAPGLGFGHLFPFIAAANPLQTALIASIDRPGLYIVEAPMGMGKTEAALAASYRCWEEGQGAGLYFALPTQLTSNRIHQRVATFLESAVADPSIISLVHGNAWMKEERVLEIFPTASASGEEGAADAGQWYASGRKSLLAPFGVGTIDQALMAAMNLKHSGLRLFALSGKVVVFDEVHSYDPYTSALVDRCVEWLLAVGCTVIVLSATLSITRRCSLVAAAGGKEENPGNTYPLITKVAVGDSTVESIGVADSGLRRTDVAIERHHGDFSGAWEQAIDAAEKGACVLVVRNTVASAQETYRLLKSQSRDHGLRFGLLHSRFPQFQRELQEEEWMSCLGRDVSRRPPGCILVATQVVEQSVDIDADLMITDLTPVDLILQRIGRLHRHARPRLAGFETPRCLVLAPVVDWTADPATLRKSLGASGFIYPPFSLYQASRILDTLPQDILSLPGDIRGLVEDSCSEPDHLPPGAAWALEDLHRVTRSMENVAAQADVFRALTQDDKEDAKRSQTRWGSRPTAMLILLRAEPRAAVEFMNGTRLPLPPRHPFDRQLALELHRNAVRIPRYIVAPLLSKQPKWLTDHIEGAVIAIVDGSSAACQIYPENHHLDYLIEYHQEMGIIYHKNASTGSELISDPEEDGWF